MKVIDLLNKIAKGEEVPQEIKWKKYNFRYDERCFDYWCDNLYDVFDTYYLFKAIFKDGKNHLTEEIEIIEEDKKIEKLKSSRIEEEFKLNNFNEFDLINIFSDKINELIEKVNELKAQE